MLSPADIARIEAVHDSDGYSRELIEWRLRWLTEARPKQLPPAVEWEIWNILAGRGFGKTRMGAEDAGYYASSSLTPVRVGVIAPTQNDCRSVCFEGESGLLNVIPPYFVRKYNTSELEIELRNGSLIIGKSAEKPDRLRGPNWHRLWCDELASWGAVTGEGGGRNGKKKEGKRLQETWDNAMFGLRLGTQPRTVITTTPRPLDFLRKLVKNPRAVTTSGSTFENDKLAASALRMFREVYEGTRRGEQELFAKILDVNENALWKPAQLEALRVKAVPEGVTFLKLAIAIDPAVTTEDDSDETGIVAAGLGDDGIIYVLTDLSGHMPPREWARVALTAYERLEANVIVGETNQGGDLVESNLKAEAKREDEGLDDIIFHFRGVHAKRGKYLRAEPVAAYYEKRKVRHVGYFPELESQMTNYTGSTVNGSPDRLDALVYAILELMLGHKSHAFW